MKVTNVEFPLVRCPYPGVFVPDMLLRKLHIEEMACIFISSIPLKVTHEGCL
jgi:hypothetical protein